MSNETQGPVQKVDSNQLVVHKSCYYRDGIRKVYRGSGAWQDETDEEFLQRFTSGQNISVLDLEQCVKHHPLILQYASEGKDFEAVITGIVEGVVYRTLFKDHGFHSWGTFRAMTEFLCPGLKAMFNHALELREEYRLERAEEALEKRAIDGVKEEVYTQSGKLAGYRTRYSDKCLEMHLKALAPDKYSEKHQHEVKGMVISVNMGLRDGTEVPPGADAPPIDV